MLSTLYKSIAALALFGLVAALTARFGPLAQRLGLLDRPNQRSSHTETRPRAGGVVFILVWMLFSLVLAVGGDGFSSLAIALLPGAALVALVGFLDDRLSLSAKTRFLVQLLAVMLFLFSIHGVSQLHLFAHTWHFGLVSTLFAALLMLWSINLFNFMDGLDGIAGVETLFVLVVGGVFLSLSGLYPLAILAWSLASCVAGFLYCNWPPAKIFMGDVGSATLGFIIIAIALLGQKLHSLSLVPWFILYGVFLFDATTTLLRRILRGDTWYQSHRKHAYQRLHQAGWSHQQVLTAVITINSILACFACLAFLLPQLEWLMLLCSLATLCISYWRVEKIYPLARVT